MTDDLLKMIVDDTVEKMTDAVAHSRREFATVRTGRASSSLVERLTVEAYGVGQFFSTRGPTVAHHPP